MRFSIALLLIALVLALTGFVSCNDGGSSSDGDNGQISTKPGTNSTQSGKPNADGGSNDAPDADGDGVTEVVTGDEDWPAQVPKYPGSEVVYQDADPSGESWGALQSTKDGKDKVLKFYRSKLEANGFDYRSTNEVDGAIVDHYDHDDMTVNVGWEENEHGRAITLLVMGYSMKGAFDDEEGDAGSEAGDGDSDGEGDDNGGDTEDYTLSDTLTGFAHKALKPYPGAEVTQEITDGKESAMMQSIQADGDEIMVFYEKHWKSLGFKRTDNIDMGEMRMIAFSGPAGEISCTIISTGDGYMATNVFTVGEGGESTTADTGSDDGSSSDGVDDGGEFTVSTGDLPDGWPLKVLPQYKGSKIESAAINGDEYTLLQRSTDPDNELVKFYDKHFREAGWKKISSQTVMGRYIGGWEKDGWSIDMTCSKDESGGSFTSLVYYK